jgi:DNA-binding HxlR family transcriptional regulator
LNIQKQKKASDEAGTRRGQEGGGSPNDKPHSMVRQLPDNLRSACPLAAGLDIFGDKWSLLIVRDMILYDRHRYGEFLAAGEGITTNILADRLKRLEAHGIIEKRPYQRHPVRNEYHLTEKGRDLELAMRAIIDWGLKYVPGTGYD